MRITPRAGHCANPECTAEFRKLGEGRLYIVPIEDSKAFDVPSHVRQKSVWLCASCSSSMYIRFDRRNHLLQLCNKSDEHRVA